MTPPEAHRRLLGSRIRGIRESLSWPQARLAEAIGFSSAQIISSIETGQRDVKAWELFRIAKALYVPVESLLTGEPTPTASVEWRERSEVASREVESGFLERSRRFALVEEWCGMQPPRQLSGLQLGPTPTFEEVQREAEKVQRYMELGARPSLSLLKSLEEDYGVKIFHEDLEEQGAALSAKGSFGLAVLLNSKDAPWRRNFSLAHELFHLLAPVDLTTLERDRLEQLANVFASQLLLPADPILEFLDSRAKEAKLSYADIVEAARHFAVSTEALLWRLANLRRTPREVVAQVLADETFRALDRASFPKWDPPARLPERYVRLCLTAYRKGRVSLARLADFLETSLVDLAEDIAQLEEKEGADAQVPVG